MKKIANFGPQLPINTVDLARLTAAEFLQVSSRSTQDEWNKVDQLAQLIRTNFPEKNLYLEYIARTLYVEETHSAGYTPIRWGVLREDRKEHFRVQATKLVEAWHAEEEEARQRRGEIPHPNDPK